jgi:hypothetical protein
MATTSTKLSSVIPLFYFKVVKRYPSVLMTLKELRGARFAKTREIDNGERAEAAWGKLGTISEGRWATV